MCRLQRSDARPDVVIAVGGEGAAAVRTGGTAVVVPPADPELLPALNRRLSEAGIPWQYEALPARGEARIGESRIPVPLEDVRVAVSYRLVGQGSTGGAEVLARLDDGSAWLVRGRTGAGSYRLVGSALDDAATNLPVSAFMVPLLEWLVSNTDAESGVRAIEAGTPLSLPAAATAVETPDGTSSPVDPSLDFRVTRQPGIYRVLAGDSVLDAVAVNPPLRESLLEPADEAAVTQAFGENARTFTDSTAWAGAVFASRQGDELVHPLIALALILLIVESFAAASGIQAARWSGRGEAAPAEPAAPGLSATG